MPLLFQYADLELIFLSGCPNNGVHRQAVWDIHHMEPSLRAGKNFPAILSAGRTSIAALTPILLN